MFLKGRNLDECLNTKQNNLDFIRFIAAVLVIYSHAFPISTGNNASETFAVLTGGQWTFGDLAVKTFFVISGLLITQSFDRSKDFSRFVKARFLRIFPGLIVIVLLSIFILGPIFTTLEIKDYFTNYQTLEYMKTITLYWLQFDLPGVFENNIYPVAINGSLWTLWFEFAFYGVVAILGLSKLLNKWIVLMAFGLATYFYSISFGGFYSDLFRFFGAGMLFYLFRNKIILNHWLALVSFIVMLISMKLGYFGYFFEVFGAYLIFYLAFHTKIKLHQFGKYGDFSYGIYIYAFPVQQVVSHYIGTGMTPFQNFVISFPITLIFSIASWHLVEKKALKFKSYSLKKNIVTRSEIGM